MNSNPGRPRVVYVPPYLMRCSSACTKLCNVVERLKRCKKGEKFGRFALTQCGEFASTSRTHTQSISARSADVLCMCSSSTVSITHLAASSTYRIIRCEWVHDVGSASRRRERGSTLDEVCNGHLESTEGVGERLKWS